MNERIIETPLGTVLLFRDLDENQADVLVVQTWPSDEVVMKTTLTFSSADKVRQVIRDYTLAQAARYIDSYNTLTV